MGHRWKVTVRSGPDVNRTAYDDLDAALGAARSRVDELAAEAPLKKVKAIRDYEPAKRTKARVEISGKGLFRPPVAGVDIRGDNTVVGYTGAVRRQALKPTGTVAIFKALKEFLGNE